MPEEQHFRVVFVKKLAYYMNRDGKNQMDLMNDLHLSSSTVSSWCTGKKLPRMNKIQMLADYFGIELSDLIEEEPDEEQQLFYLEEDERRLLNMYQYLDERGRTQLFVRCRELIRLGHTTYRRTPGSIAAELSESPDD